MMKRTNSVARPEAAPSPTQVARGWRRKLTAAAVACVLAVPAQQVWALTLGRVTVQSALGQPLRAEVELPDITEEEARSLAVSIAPAEAYRAAGLDYSPALASIGVRPQRRADGRMVLAITSRQPVSEPFLDLILQANWSSGRAVRDYTLLLDPPPQPGDAASASTAPQLPAAPAPAPAPAPAVTTAPSPATPPPAASAPPAPSSGDSVTVRRGDTASQIAQAHKPAQVSLDQMLVAMLRSNPDAFIRGNVNLLRAGAVLELPSAEQAASVPRPEASRIVAAQARDFNAYRSQLAGQVPALPSASERSATGRVQAQVEDRGASGAAADKLTLSKGGVQASREEDRIARERAASEAAERVAELSRNIEELNRLGAGTPAPAAPAPAAAPEPAAEPPATAPAPAPASAPAPAPAVAPEPAPTLPAPPAASAMPTDAEASGPLARLTSQPWLLFLLAALMALLSMLGLRRARQRREMEATEPELPSAPSKAFVANSGGQHVDTTLDDVTAAGIYAPHEIDATGDVDPLDEAEVYLEHGRDLQAEEILKEALRTSPDRTDLQAKLAGIYARRRDAVAFLAIAEKAHTATNGSGADWERIAALGRELQPEHRLWRTAGTAAAGATAAATAGALAPAADLYGPPKPTPTAPPADAPAPVADAATPAAPAPHPFLDIDLNLGDEADPPDSAAPAAASPATPAPAAVAPAPADPLDPPLADRLVFDLDDSRPPTAAAAASTAPATPATPAPLPFDLGALSLDIGDDSPGGPAPATEPEAADPLVTKLALAEEFQAIGDEEGARALAEEVLAVADGPVREQAQRFLATLG